MALTMIGENAEYLLLKMRALLLDNDKLTGCMCVYDICNEIYKFDYRVNYAISVWVLII